MFPLYRHYHFEFQHTAARRRLPQPLIALLPYRLFQHTAARRRLQSSLVKNFPATSVSTHSRPKAAAPYIKKQEKSVH